MAMLRPVLSWIPAKLGLTPSLSRASWMRLAKASLRRFSFHFP
jgi:hypothetical protein